MLIAGHPLHGSGRAELPHPALVSGHNRKSSTQSIHGIGMTDSRVWYPALERSGKPLPRKPRFLASTPQRLCQSALTWKAKVHMLSLLNGTP